MYSNEGRTRAALIVLVPARYTHRGVIAIPTFKVDYNITEWVETAKFNSSTQQQ